MKLHLPLLYHPSFTTILFYKLFKSISANGRLIFYDKHGSGSERKATFWS